jgi:outer membrane protein
MTRRTGRVAVGGALALLVLSAPAWADLKIGYVNYARLMQESPQAKAVQDKLRTEFAGKQKELNDQQQQLKNRQAQLERDQGTMSADQRTAAERVVQDDQRELQEKATEYQDDFNSRQNQEMSALSKVVVEQVQAYAQSQGFDLVMADGVIWANPTIDITAPVLAALQSRGTGAGAAAPAAPAASGTRSRSSRSTRSGQ